MRQHWRNALGLSLLALVLTTGCAAVQTGSEEPMSQEPDETARPDLTGIEAAEAEYLAQYRAEASGVESRIIPCAEAPAAGEAQWCPEPTDEQETVWVEIPVPVSDDDTPNEEMDPPDDR